MKVNQFEGIGLHKCALKEKGNCCCILGREPKCSRSICCVLAATGFL